MQFAAGVQDGLQAGPKPEPSKPKLPGGPVSTRRALLIVNPHSRRGCSDLGGTVRRLEDRGIAVLRPALRDACEIPDLIRAHGERVDLVIVGGGDGTLNAAADALVETGLPLGVLPLGTANDLARTLGIPADPIAACDIILAGRRRAIDLGVVNGKHFFNVASMGLSVEVSRLHVGARKRWLRVANYLLCAVQALRAARPFTAEIRCDGQVVQVCSIQIAVGNGRHYGGGLTVAEDAAIDDQRLDLYTIAPQPLWKLAVLVPALRWGRYGRLKEIRLMQGREIEIHTAPLLPINTDGEVTTMTPARFHVAARALTVFVPADYSSPAEAD